MIKFNLNYHVIDRCNKNCIACGHYAPLADPRDTGVSVEQFKKDLDTCEFLKPHVREFCITGGEPTLHKDLKELIRLATERYDRVNMITNGIDLSFIRDNADFIRECGVNITLTNYSQKRIQEAADILGYVEGNYIPRLDNGEGERVLFNTKHLAYAEVNPELRMCDRGLCVQYRDGKLYMCQVAANLHLLKDRFGDRASTFTEDGTFVDLSQTQDIDVIENLLYRATPELCRHCNEPFYQNDEKSNSRPLRTSSRQLSEWVEEVEDGENQ